MAQRSFPFPHDWGERRQIALGRTIETQSERPPPSVNPPRQTFAPLATIDGVASFFSFGKNSEFSLIPLALHPSCDLGTPEVNWHDFVDTASP